MKHLVILAHPYSKSFSNGIVAAISEEVMNNNSEIRVRDLNKIGFDPILKNSDLINLQTKNYADDIKAEQEYITWADMITFVYPVWWAGLPAIMKGYVDRVFANGFAFANGDKGPHGLLSGKKALLICTTGFPNQVYEQIGMHNSMKQTTDSAIFEFCGMEVIDHIFLGSIPSSKEEEREQYLMQIKSKMKENC